MARELAKRRINRPYLHRSEFDEVMLDVRIPKYLCLWDDGTIRGFATCTNELESVLNVSPEFFAANWSSHYREQRIWLCGLAGAGPDDDADAYYGIFEQILVSAGSRHGLIVVDNSRLSDQAQRIWRRLEGEGLREVGPPGIESSRLYEALTP